MSFCSMPVIISPLLLLSDSSELYCSFFDGLIHAVFGHVIDLQLQEWLLLVRMGIGACLQDVDPTSFCPNKGRPPSFNLAILAVPLPAVEMYMDSDTRILNYSTTSSPSCFFSIFSNSIFGKSVSKSNIAKQYYCCRLKRRELYIAGWAGGILVTAVSIDKIYFIFFFL